MKTYLKLLIISTLITSSCSKKIKYNESLPKQWVLLTETDSGFIVKSHYDNGTVHLNIDKKDTVQIIGDHTVINFQINSITKKKNSIFNIMGKVEIQNEIREANMIFEWIDKKEELAKWSFIENGDTLMKDYFSSM